MQAKPRGRIPSTDVERRLQPENVHAGQRPGSTVDVVAGVGRLGGVHHNGAQALRELFEKVDPGGEKAGVSAQAQMTK